MGAIRSTKISGNFGPKLNGSVRSNRNSFEKTGPPFEVVLFSRSDRSEILVEWIAPNAYAKYGGGETKSIMVFSEVAYWGVFLNIRRFIWISHVFGCGVVVNTSTIGTCL